MNTERKKRFTANKKTRKRQQRQNFARVLKKFGCLQERALGALVTHDMTMPRFPRISAKFAFLMPRDIVVAVR